jgi:HEPN domain-containing protein
VKGHAGDTWLRDAEQQDWKNAYFHVGQAVEFAIKAIYLKQNSLNEWPSAMKGAAFHDLGKCASLCGLDDTIQHENDELIASWKVAIDWQSSNRFPGMSVREREAKDLCAAVNNPTNGVMKWLRARYQMI